MAVAIKIQTTPAALLASPAQGWHTVRSGIVRPVPGDEHGIPTIPIRVDAFEWVDVTLFGIGNADTALAQLRAAIKQRGSDLYAYALFTRTDVDLFGVKAVRYRMLLLHSFVELAEWAVAIVAIAFAAVIFLQYVTTGQAPALKDLQNLWGSAVSSVGAAAGNVAGSVTNTYLGWVAAAGAVAIGLGLVAKAAGTRAPSGPKLGGRLGINAGPVRGSIGA